MPTAFPNDTPAQVFEEAWPGGYVESFDCYPPGAEKQVAALIARFANAEGTCVEIGPGGGYWTLRYLARMFRRVICIDVIPRPATLHAPRIEYIAAPDRDFTCPGVPAGIADFVFSFGVFCHLSRAACGEYLQAVHRVLRPGACALLMFANWQAHADRRQEGEAMRRFAVERYADGPCWFYCDPQLVQELALAAGFPGFVDALPGFRDTLALLTKAAP